MMRRIDADALKKDLTRFYDGMVTAKQLIDEQPTIDAMPVVHGRWVFCGDDDIICNVCGARYLKERLLQSYYTGIGSDKMDGFWHCPHCGALLDGGENND